jgi:hypothetical protein
MVTNDDIKTLLTEIRYEKIKQFKKKRIKKLKKESIFNVCMHLIPFNALDHDYKCFDSNGIYQKAEDLLIPKNYHADRDYVTPPSSVFTLNGLELIYKPLQPSKYRKKSVYRDDECLRRIQLYRNGIVEYCDNSAVKEENNKSELETLNFQRNTKIALSELLNYQKEWDLEPPILLFISLINVKDYVFYGIPFDRNLLELPEVKIDDLDTDIDIIIKPLFDMVWNSCGIKESPNFNKEGKWQPPRS